MAGQPVLQNLAAKIEAAGGDEWVFDLVAAGVPFYRVAERLGVSDDVLRVWVRRGGEKRKEAYQRARKESADALADKGGRILDELAEGGRIVTSPEVALAQARANYRLKLAEAFDRDTFGNKPVAALQFNVGTLHLGALQAAGAAPGAAVEAPVAVVEPERVALAPVEIIDGEESAEDPLAELLEG